MTPTQASPSVLNIVQVVLLLGLVASNALAAAHGGEAERRVCPDGTAAVQDADAADFADVCAGVSGALGFLAVHGIRPTEPVKIRVTAAIPEEAGPTAAGCYLEHKRHVYVVPYRVFRKNKTWFGVNIGRELYRSLAAHEAAHAVAACHFRVPLPSIQAKEYVAYVAMFASMSPELRRQALRATRAQGFESLDRFTPLLYMFDPMRFGAEAYRHFFSTGNRTELLQEILAGKVLND